VKLVEDENTQIATKTKQSTANACINPPTVWGCRGSSLKSGDSEIKLMLER